MKNSLIDDPYYRVKHLTEGRKCDPYEEGEIEILRNGNQILFN